MLGVLRQAAFDWPLLGSILATLAPSSFDTNPGAACAALTSFRNLNSPLNTTILGASYFSNASTGLQTLGVCASSADVSVPLCRVQFTVNTSSKSHITGEVWLPAEWTGRSLVLGNGGLGGCKHLFFLLCTALSNIEQVSITATFSTGPRWASQP